MIRQHDHQLPLSPDLDIETRLDEHGRPGLEQVEVETSEWTWLLEVQYNARGRLRLPSITVLEDGRRLFTQYLESGQAGRRLINLNGAQRLNALSLAAHACQLTQEVRLLGFRKPNLSDGPLMIIAPHPDDAELAAFGLYHQHAERTWIITLTAGERHKRLDRQYLPDLDTNLKDASRRKGAIRAWNSATTPMLAGLRPSRLHMLGYFNDTLSDLLKAPEARYPSLVDDSLTPADFRTWNTQALPSDNQEGGPRNCGDDLLKDLKALLSEIRPSTVAVAHPELDPHPDHQAAAHALALAIQHSGHTPQRVLLYANHLKSQRGFPRGPAHAAAGLWPVHQASSVLGKWSIYSHFLTPETQREKAVAMDSMHDLRDRPSLERRLKRFFKRRLTGIPKHDWPTYGQHDYFQTHIKAHEVFALVDTAGFLALLQER